MSGVIELSGRKRQCESGSSGSGSPKKRESLETKLKKWQCEGQGELFGADEARTSEVRAWREKQR